MDLTQMIETVVARHETLRPADVNVNLRAYDAAFRPNLPPRLLPVEDNGADAGLILAPHALSQLLTRLHIPGDYFHRCPAELQTEQVNYWLTQLDKPQAVFRQAYGNTVRAIVSARYGVMDDINVLPLVADILGDQEAKVELDFGGAYGDFTHVRIRFPRIQTEPRLDDVIQAGIHIGNSEVGGRRLTVEAMLYRLVCTNGLIVGAATERLAVRHIGNFDKLKDGLAQAILAAQRQMPQLMTQFNATAGVTMPVERAATALETLYTDDALTRVQVTAVQTEFVNVQDMTLYGLVNAVTRVAQQEETFERRYLVERAASRLMSLN